VYILAAILLWTAAVQAAPFDGQSAKSFLDTLCSRQFAGRKSGDPEMANCERWAAGNYAHFGLEPGGSDGYLQPFPILSNREEKASFELVNGYHGRKKYVEGEDFDLITNSGSGKVQAEVVFAGYGVNEPGKDWDDFAGIDLKGKIALIFKGVPGPDRLWDKEKWRDYKVNKAVGHGAVGIIFVHDTYAINGAAIHKDAFHPGVPIIIVSEYVMEDLFRGTGKRWSNVKTALEKAPQSFATGHTVKIETRLKYNPDAKACNVVGILPGSDSTLKHEWIVIGGHMDHNGVNARGDVFYGADDNASGASVVMELARAFASVYPTPKRSLMFIDFAAEEQGLLGSQWFVDHPTIPLEKIAAMFNFDMCGMGNGGVGFGGAEHFPEIWEAYQAQMDSAARANLTLSTIWHGGSDNSSFQDKGIPTFNYWSAGDHPFYHHQEDLPGKIAATTLGNVGTEAAHFITYMANWEKPVITENYKERTWLYSACRINLNPMYKNPDPPPRHPLDNSLSVSFLDTLHDQGLKCVTASIGFNDPYSDVDRWKEICKKHDYVWALKADDIRQAMRQQKLAIMPRITYLPFMDSSGVQLRNLVQMGVKTINISGLGPDSVLGKNLIKMAADLGCVFICPDTFRDQIPTKARKILMFTDTTKLPALPGKVDLGKIRWMLSDNFKGLGPDSAGTTQRVAGFGMMDYEVEYGPKSLQMIKNLEQAGFSGQDIVYMLGENLLEILP
jgi:hypothetical protein